MKIIKKFWIFLIEYSEQIHEYRRKNPRVNAWY